MSKSVTTRWYIVAWVVWAVALIVFFTTAHTQTTSVSVVAQGTSPISLIAWLIAAACAIVMFVMWIGALVKLGQLGRWAWFVLVLVLQLVGLGIIGMIAYAVGGPSDDATVTRPSFT